MNSASLRRARLSSRAEALRKGQGQNTGGQRHSARAGRDDRINTGVTPGDVLSAGAKHCLGAELLGINVDGIPGAENPRAFAVVTALLLGLGGLQVTICRRVTRI